jgi:hypothetical protein
MSDKEHETKEQPETPAETQDETPADVSAEGKPRPEPDPLGAI